MGLEAKKSVQEKHTPGPWQISGVADKRVITHATDTSVYPVCTVTADNIKRYGAGDLDANARLIAAAPEMLGFIEKTKCHCAEDFYGGVSLHVCERCKLIAKATGGA